MPKKIIKNANAQSNEKKDGSFQIVSNSDSKRAQTHPPPEEDFLHDLRKKRETMKWFIRRWIAKKKSGRDLKTEVLIGISLLTLPASIGSGLWDILGTLLPPGLRAMNKFRGEGEERSERQRDVKKCTDPTTGRWFDAKVGALKSAGEENQWERTDDDSECGRRSVQDHLSLELKWSVVLGSSHLDHSLSVIRWIGVFLADARHPNGNRGNYQALHKQHKPWPHIKRSSGIPKSWQYPGAMVYV